MSSESPPPAPSSLFGRTVTVVFCLVIGAWLWALGPGRMGYANVRSRLSPDEADMRRMAIAFQQYRVDHGAFPPSIPMASVVPDPDALATHKAEGMRVPGGLTTPFAYMEGLPLDRFANLPYAYWVGGDWALLAAPGPDEVFNLPPAKLPADTPTEDPKPFLRLHYAYDPTNGSYSPGDVYRIIEASPERLP